MRILSLDDDPFHAITFLNAGKRGGTVSEMLPFFRGQVDELPDGVDALLVTSDLQGVARHPRYGGELALLGEVVAEIYADLSDDDKVPDYGGTGVVLAGDFYSAPGGDKRGASGG